MMKKFDKIQEKNPFKVPENYFDEVSRKIISATSGYIPEIKKESVYRRLKSYLAVAASIAGFVLISYITVKLFVPDKKISNLSDIDLIEVSDLWINDINILTLEENAASLVLFEQMPEVDKTDIIEYLLLENIDINDIYEQL